MAAAIQVGTDQAVIDGYRWTGENKNFVQMLQNRLDPWGPSGADPNPDLTAAEEAVEALGGQILWADETEELPEGAIA